MTEVVGQTVSALLPAPSVELEQGRYRLRFVRSRDELDEIQHLRFRVFNLELGEGLDVSFATERDEDGFDNVCHHLLVEDRTTSTVIGTYRMQTLEMAGAVGAFYSAGEFGLEDLPDEMLCKAVEVGRACIALEHRNRQVLFLLWRGLARYLQAFDKRYLFGCCSLTSQDPCKGLRLYRQLGEQGKLHPHLSLQPRSAVACECAAVDVESQPSVELPQLFATYLRYGGLVCAPPAIDREFKTIDYFVMLDSESLDPRTYRLFFN